MNSPFRIKRKKREKTLKTLNRFGHFLMAIYFAVFNMIPQNGFALTGGPSQPEVQSFEPIGTSEMVDLFSGDFVYNLPLLDVGGYPINLSYHSGITNDQEASWVGLGWNVNPGTINRAMRGIPDDFDGDLIKHEMNTKPSITVGLNGGLDFELFGKSGDKFTGGLGVTAGIKFNNYKGIGMEAGLNITASINGANGGKLTGGLGLNSSSDDGLSLQPSVSLSVEMGGKGSNSLGSSIGTSINSRTGMQQLSISTSIKSGKNSSFSANLAGASFDFGQPTFSPQVGMQMKSFSMTARFATGGEVFGAELGGHLSGYYNEQRLSKAGENTENPAYGYFHVENGQNNAMAVMDFNREKDGGFTENTPCLPVTNFTYDIYSVSGQGVGGSYRGFRSEVGYVFDAKGKSSSNSKSIGVEVGVGNFAHSGGDYSSVKSEQNSGKWSNNGNDASDIVSFKKDKPYPDYEPFYLKEANEKSVSSDPEYLNRLGGVDPVSFKLDSTTKFNTKLKPSFIKNDGTEIGIQNTYRKKRENRNQILTFLNRGQLELGLGIDKPHQNSFDAPKHHIAEITTLNTSGERYIYGIAAYNLSQQDVSFAVGAELDHDNALPGDYESGLVTYTPGKHDSKKNNMGIDHYFNKTTTPAYAHSYLITNILSADYVDSDGFKGPSDGDLGTYTRFTYKKSNRYKWRTPVGKNKANWSDGLKSDPYDDKASYTYGEKEIWYLDSIITKNHVAIFELGTRDDAHSVVNNTGEIDKTHIMQRIKKISLFSKIDLQQNPTSALPIKEVHFEYDYSLCQGIPNSSSVVTGEKGKLTLKSIYFTYQNSTKGANSKYNFDYGTNNPDYNIKSYDRWGNYKLNDVTSSYFNGANAIPAAEFPYVDQNKDVQDVNASAWNLRSIKLPSGGVITIDYESDDYAFVQNKKAKRMIKIVGTSVDTIPDLLNLPATGGQICISQNKFIPGSLDLQKNNFLIVELPQDYSIGELLSGNSTNLYFRCLANTLQENVFKKYDYVSGYADLLNYGDAGSTGTVGNNDYKEYAWVQFQGVKFGDGVLHNPNYNPITLATIQYARLHLSKFVWNSTGIGEPMNFGKQLLLSMVQVISNLVSGLGNQNKKLWKGGVGNNIIAGKSWLKLNVKDKKLGGGSRVERVTISDEWNALSGGTDALYGQEYKYTLADGETSSGVAAYEPQIGGDENPFREPVFHTKKVLLAPDERMYQEKPFGESFFPSASVGYSRVTVSNIKPTGIDLNKHATGKVVNEFYTAKDFPTITEMTKIILKRDKTNKLSLASLLNRSKRDYLTATQGFSIELNDMHGKPKGTYVYGEGGDLISSKSFKYKSDRWLSNSNRLTNKATVVDKHGNVNENAEIGVVFDMVADFRRQTSTTSTDNVKANLDAFLIPPPIIVTIPIIYGTYSENKTQFHSATTTKVIQRFGLLEETVITDLGSSVTTKTIAYDAETGTELITETTNNFDDKIYNMNFPAYWYYENMGQAYKNIGFEANGLNFNNGLASYVGANKYFFKGDELEVVGSGTRIWVSSVGVNNLKAIKSDGNNYNGSSINVRVLRSGRKNMIDGQMASLTTYANPLNAIKKNVYEKVVQASAIEFTDQWRTYCDCEDDGSGNLNTSNPFVLGTEGNYKPKATYSYLTERTQELKQDNLNIRRDGVYESFSPFYRVNSSKKWKKDYRNWTFTEMITEFNPNGGQLESKDALDRYSGETYGYNNSVVTASAGNARYQEIGFDGFEDHNYVTCGDQHFRFSGDLSSESHSGSKSLKVDNGQNVTLYKQIDPCVTNPCEITVNQMVLSGYTHFGLTNATAPVDVTWNVLSGNPVVLPSSSSGYLIKVQNSTTYQLSVHFTDDNGCEVSTSITL